MLRRLVDFSLENRPLVLIASMLVVVGGGYALTQLPLDFFALAGEPLAFGLRLLELDLDGIDLPLNEFRTLLQQLDGEPTHFRLERSHGCGRIVWWLRGGDPSRSRKKIYPASNLAEKSR